MQMIALFNEPIFFLLLSNYFLVQSSILEPFKFGLSRAGYESD